MVAFRTHVAGKAEAAAAARSNGRARIEARNGEERSGDRRGKDTRRGRPVRDDDDDDEAIASKSRLFGRPSKASAAASDDGDLVHGADADYDRAGAVVDESSAEPEPEFVPEPEPILIPAGAPQVIVRSGAASLVRGSEVIPPFFFSVGEDALRQWPSIAEECKLATEAGTRVIQVGIDFSIGTPVEDIANDALKLLQSISSVHSEALVLFQLNVSAPFDWKTRFPDSFADRSAESPSLFDDDYWNAVEGHLGALISALRSSPLASQVLGIHLGSKPWRRAAADGYDHSRAAAKAFRKWTRARYSNDIVTLRAAWFDGQVSFDTLDIPPYAPEGSEGERFVRSSRKQRRFVDYHLFLSDGTAKRLRSLASLIKRASEGWFLVGASCGFTFEWSHPASGHLALGKILRCPAIDFISGPPSSRERHLGGTAAFPGPIDSIALNGKLFISDEEFKTSLSGVFEDDDLNPLLRTPQALESAHWRGAGAAAAHGFGLNWSDAHGRGWLKSQGIWRRAAQIREMLMMRMAAAPQDPEAVVFVDERSLAYLVDPNAFLLLVQNVCDAAHRSGLRIGFYLLSDLAHREHFPEAKLYIFLNAWDMRPEFRTAVKNRLQRDGKVLFWLYAAALFDGGRDASERIREVTGIALKPQPFHSKSGTMLVNRRHPLSNAFPDRAQIGGSKLEPSYFAIYDESEEVLGEYMQSGLPSFVTKTFGSSDEPEEFWTSVFLGEPIVSPALIRALGSLAGAHLYNVQEDAVHVSPPFISVHTRAGGQRTIPLPPNCTAYDLHTQNWANLDGSSVRFSAADNSTYNFLFGSKEEVDRLLHLKQSELLHIEQLPPRDLNVKTQDDNLDIPIMRLADYMEGSLTEEDAEEWLLKPIATEPEFTDADSFPAPPQRDRGRRRGRTRPNGRNGQDRPKPDAFSEEAGVSAFFRKRV